MSQKPTKKARYDSEGCSINSSSSDESDVEITGVFRPFGYYADDKPDSLPGSSSSSENEQGVESSQESSQGSGSPHSVVSNIATG